MNSSCLLNQLGIGWKYDNTIQSSLTIYGNSFELNRIYEFQVEMINYENSSMKLNNYLIVRIQEKSSPLILIRYSSFAFYLK
jgi:hypothetical protein